jgi:anti-anti-sigma factor
MEDLQISVEKEIKELPVVIKLSGYMDSSTSYKLTEVVDELIKEGYLKMIYDFENLEYLSSAGISVIMETFDELKLKEGDLRLVGVSKRIYKIMDLCGLTKIIKILSNSKEALESFKEEVKEEKDFPLKINCPGCSFSGTIPNSDIYKCPRCNEIFYIDSNGKFELFEKIKKQEEKDTSKLDIWIKSDISYTSAIRKFIGSIALKEGFSEESASEIELALDEALANIIEHAYNFDFSKSIGINVTIDKEKLTITLIDKGKTFDITALQSKDEFFSSKGPYRGRGKYIIKKLMDEVSYISYSNVENKLIMVKKKKDIDKGGDNFIKLV